MQAQIDQVRQFMRKNNLPLDLSLLKLEKYSNESELLYFVSSILKACSDRMEEVKGIRIRRGHQVVEETSELLFALAQGDPVETLDALCDLDYVTKGLACTFDLPLAEGFEEVHRSNMTKESRKLDDPRIRDKGANYSPPDLDKVMELHEAKKKGAQ